MNELALQKGLIKGDRQRSTPQMRTSLRTILQGKDEFVIGTTASPFEEAGKSRNVFFRFGQNGMRRIRREGHDNANFTDSLLALRLRGQQVLFLDQELELGERAEKEGKLICIDQEGHAYFLTSTMVFRVSVDGKREDLFGIESPRRFTSAEKLDDNSFLVASGIWPETHEFAPRQEAEYELVRVTIGKTDTKIEEVPFAKVYTTLDMFEKQDTLDRRERLFMPPVVKILKITDEIVLLLTGRRVISVDREPLIYSPLYNLAYTERIHDPPDILNFMHPAAILFNLKTGKRTILSKWFNPLVSIDRDRNAIILAFTGTVILPAIFSVTDSPTLEPMPFAKPLMPFDQPNIILQCKDLACIMYWTDYSVFYRIVKVSGNQRRTMLAPVNDEFLPLIEEGAHL